MEKAQSIRERMIRSRQSIGITIAQRARSIGISEHLLGLVEGGSVTAPDIAYRIAAAYGLTRLEAEDLMPEHRRPSSEGYDPDKWVDRAYDPQYRTHAFPPSITIRES